MTENVWTHWYIPILCHGYSVKCKIVKTRRGFLAKLFGDTRIVTICGYQGWVYSDDMLEILE